MKVKYGVLLLMILLSTGCAKLQREKKPEFNPIVHDSHFQQAMSIRKIKLVAPGSGTEPEQIQQLHSFQFLNVEIPENLVTKAIAFHANSDEERLKLLKSALNDNSKNTIVWSLRGGYGSARLINDLNKLPKPKYEKVFIGYSDMTALHLFLSQNWQWKTINGAGLLDLLNAKKDPQNFEKIVDILSKKNRFASITNLKLLNPAQFKQVKLTGPLTGGNLTIVQTSLGTNWQIQTAGKILFLEDVGEKGYQVDRALNQLKQAGVLKNVKAIVFGDFADPVDDKVDLALDRFAQEMKMPVFKTDQFGHGKKNYPLIYNAASEIVRDKNNESETFNLNMKI